MVRGRRKIDYVINKCQILNEDENFGKYSNIQRKLQHNSASPPAMITSFFPTQVTKALVNQQSPSLVIGRASPRKHASTLSVLQQANSGLNVQVVNSVVNRYQSSSVFTDKCGMVSQNSPSAHKIELPFPPLQTFTLQSQNKTIKPRKKPASSVNLMRSPLSSRSVSDNHKLTEYFPVRRSVRKTKKIVQEENQRCLKEAVLSKREDGLEVHMFAGKGRGIVALRPFLRGQFVVEYAGELITTDEAREREQFYGQNQNIGCYMYYFKYKDIQYCIDATAESDRLGRLVNHSRYGNLTTKTVVIDKTPHLVLIAKEDIQPGEEVTYDYGDRSKESLEHHPWLAL